MTNRNVPDEQVPVPASARIPLDWGREFSEALNWINNRAWVLGGAMLFVAVIHLHNYIAVEKLPLSISSPAAIATFPSLLALSLFLLVILGAMLLMPTAVLLTPTKIAGGALVDRMLYEPVGNRHWLMRPQLHWIAGTALIGILFWAGVWWVVEKKHGAWIGFIALLLVALTVLLAIVMVWVSGLVGKLSEIRLDYWFASLLAGVTQALLLLSVTQLVLSVVSEYVSTFLSAAPFLLLAGCLTALVQLAGVFVLKVLQTHPRPLVVAGRIAAGLMVCLLLFAPVSARLVGYAIQHTANGGRDCVTLIFMPSASGKYKAQGFHDGVGPSDGLRILFDAGDTLHIRFDRDRKDKRAVYWVARSDVAGVEGCKPERAE